jgi:predicted transposase
MDERMQQIITAKLKLRTTPEQQQLLRQTALAYRDALNFVSRFAFAHGKLSSAERLQQGTYRDIRALFKLPAQMACNVPRQVAGTYKGLWTKLKKNLAHRKAGYTKKRYRGLDQPPKYVSPTVTYNYGYDYSFKGGQQVSVLTVVGRMILPYQGYDRDALSGNNSNHDQPDSLLLWQPRAGACQPLRPPQETLAEKRHSLRRAAQDRHERTRETVETAGQSQHREIHCSSTPTHLDRSRGVDRHSRAYQKTQEERARDSTRVPQSASGQSPCFAVGLCRIP